MLSQNEKGEYALYEQGKLIGFAPTTTINGVRIIVSIYPILTKLFAYAKNDSVIITLSSGLRTWDEQVNLRIKNCIDKSKEHDTDYIINAPSTSFSPLTARPGYSNHQSGLAYDFNVGATPLFKWMATNAINYGFVRTVPSEIWHWEYRPGLGKYAVVPKDNATWSGY